MSDFSLYDFHPGLERLEIVDLGAADDPKWPPAYKPLMRAGRARVTGFEPDLVACLALSSKYKPPHRFFPVCAGDGRPARFHTTTYTQTSSLLEPNTPLLKLFHALHELTTPVSDAEVKTVRLDDAIAPDDDVDYLKLDVQGSELTVLQGGERVLGGAVALQIEVSFAELYRGQPLFADVDAYLRKQGFWLHLFPGLDPVTMNPFRTGGRQVLWTDVVYTRHPQELDALSEAKLWKLALVLHDIYRSYDFAHACLAEIDRRAGDRTQAERYRARLEQA